MKYRRNDFGQLKRIEVRDGVEGFWSSVIMECSGCFECGEYGVNAYNYEYDDKAGCYRGSGCDECGYTGKRRRGWWQPFDAAQVSI